MPGIDAEGKRFYGAARSAPARHLPREEACSKQRCALKRKPQFTVNLFATQLKFRNGRGLASFFEMAVEFVDFGPGHSMSK
jgi:hypothetical protein